MVVGNNLGDQFTSSPPFDLDRAFQTSTCDTPLIFILSPGADVVADLDKLSDKYEMEKGVSYHNISMGQGQDVIAMEKLEQAHRNGHWVILNNVHLMPRWLKILEKQLDLDLIKSLDCDDNGVDKLEFIMGMMMNLGVQLCGQPLKWDDVRPFLLQFERFDVSKTGRLSL